MTWDVLAEVLKEVLRQFLSALAAELIDRLLPKAGPVPEFKSPRELRQVIVAELMRAADGHRNAVRLRASVVALLSRVNGVMVDRVWDRLKHRGVVADHALRFEMAGVDGDAELFDLLMGDGVALAAPTDEPVNDDDTREMVPPPAAG